MEKTNLAAALLISAAALLVLFRTAWRFINWAYFRPKRLENLLRKQGIPGNRYNLVYGDMKEAQQIIKKCTETTINLDDDIKPRIAGLATKAVDAYGKVCFYWVGPTPTVVLNDSEMVKEVMNNPEECGRMRSTHPLQKLFNTGIVVMEGEEWAKRRRIMNPAFLLEKLKLMIPAFKLSCEEVMKRWDELITSGDGSGEVDVWPDLQILTFDAISRAAFGTTYEEGRRILELKKLQALNLLKTFQIIYVPGTQYLPTKLHKGMKEIENEVQTLIRGIIDRRMKESAANDDFLAILLESYGTETVASSRLTMDEIAEECKLFHGVGQETTAVLLLWTMVLLSRYPEWQERARREVLRVFGEKKPPHFDGLNQLKIVNMVLHEVLRLYPPFPTVARSLKKEAKIGKYTFPADINILLPIITLHHSKEIWGDDALEFNPERFSEGVVNAQKIPGIYIPFGWGPRVCIGQAYSLLQAKVVMSMILRNFSFQLSPSYAHAPITALTIHPQRGAPLILFRGLLELSMGVSSESFTELCSRGKLREAFATHFLLVWSKPKLVSHLLKACIGLHSVTLAFQIHAIIVAGGWWKKKFVSNSLMHAYVKLGQIDLVAKVFDKMPERNIMSCNILIGGRVRNGELDAAVDVFNAMKARNTSTWNAIVAGLINVGRDSHGWDLFAEMHSTGFSPDAYTLATVQRGCAGLQDLTRGKQIHCYAVKSGSEDDPVIGSTAHMYMRCSSLKDGEEMMNSITHRNTAAHNILIAGRVQNGDPSGALDQYHRIRSTGFRPDRITFASLVTSCSDLSTLATGQQIHAEIVKSGTLHSPAVTSSLISMYSHCACLDDAEKVFIEREESEDDFIIWSSMLAAYGFHGKGDSAIAIFNKMELKHMEASDVTFLSLLHACSHSGLKNQGRRYFDLMVKNYKLEPQVQHYTCIVDLLGRAGELEEAESIIKSMASQPDKIIWKTLLSACKIHRNTEMAERVAQEILKIDPQDSASYVLLAHSQASAQQWLKSEEARRAMRRNRTRKKEPGMSWFETKNKLHCFIVGDDSHPQWESIVSYLQQLVLEMKSHGYVPETDSVLHDMDSEEKEHNLVFHTEKLAVAFALMSTPPEGPPIRIMKNLRVCDDCHAAMKFISAVRNRAIIIRDIARFHRFENGSCSCRDYW